jgi:hypothetical protein
VALGMDMESVLDGMSLEIGYETGDVDGGQGLPFRAGSAARLPQQSD